MKMADYQKLRKNVGLAPLPKPKGEPRGMNRTEREYFEHLQLLKRLGEIEGHSFDHEPCTIRLAHVDNGRDVYYRPDFYVDRWASCNKPGCRHISRTYIEVKGTKDGKPYYQTERGRLKPIWAAQRGWPITVTWRVNGEWREERVYG